MSDHNLEIPEGPPNGPPANEGESFSSPLIAAIQSASSEEKASFRKSLFEDEGVPAPSSGAAGSRAAPEKPVTSADKINWLTVFRDNIPTILGTLVVALVIAYLNTFRDSLSETNTRVARLETSMTALAVAMARQENRMGNLESTVTKMEDRLDDRISKLEDRLADNVSELRRDLKALSDKLEIWRLETARFLPAPGIRTETAERPRSSDTAGGGTLSQDPPASPGEPAPPAG
ncbi:MAG: hypothetical protein LBT40_15800 [Deltaproteobacteria bacterium]|jgi:hypothetical protein|nr:hypothetical protein [Deltaproteobacteria bacterium]